jgi:hypothetical protein
MKTFLAIGFIWLGCAVAWMVLGSTLLVRSGDSSSALDNEVQLLWGPPVEQSPPRAFFRQPQKRKHKVTSYTPQGQPVEQEVEREEDVEIPIALVKSDLAVKLELAHRQKGLLWFATYGVDFRAAYGFENQSGAPRKVEIHFPLGARNAVYDGFAVERLDGTPIAAAVAAGDASWIEELKPGERADYVVRYRSRGTSTWRYELTAGTGQVRNFKLALDTNFAEVDFPAGTISPTRHAATGNRWHGEWAFQSLVANAPIGLELPQRLNPGPLAARITFFAPVGLLFFFFVVANFASIRGLSLHPLNYFFFGAAFFAFHLLFAYLVDHLALLPSFAIAAQVSILLVVTYARLFVGWRFALREMGIAQLLYLVLFSVSFFWQGFTGLAITVGAVLTLAVMMQVTGLAWREKLLRSTP